MSDFKLFTKYEDTKNRILPTLLKKECVHNVVKKQTKSVCTLCGQIVQNYNEETKEWFSSNKRYGGSRRRTHVRKHVVKNIYKDLEHLNFMTNELSMIANNTYKQITKDQIFRGRTRKAIIYACVIHAYNKLKKQINNDDLLKLFKITKKYGLYGLRYLNLNIDNSEKLVNNQNKHVTHLNLIKNIMSSFGATEAQMNEVNEIYYKTKNKSSRINRSRPKSIANTCVFYWIRKNKMNITLSEFSKQTNMSELTINKLLKEFDLILKK